MTIGWRMWFDRWRRRMVCFLDKTMYKYKTLEQRHPTSFPWKCIWRICVQPKLRFFTWEASWGRILALDLLQKRGLSSSQLLFPVSRQPINSGLPAPALFKNQDFVGASSILGVSWGLPLQSGIFLGWRCTFCAMDKQRVWNAGSLCIFWTLWNTRNNIVFKDEFLSM